MAVCCLTLRCSRLSSKVGRMTSDMAVKFGEVEALFRYPVKSTAGKASMSQIWAGMALTSSMASEPIQPQAKIRCGAR